MPAEGYRFRTADEMKARITANIRTLNRRLVQVALRLERITRGHPMRKTVPGKILTSFYRKAVNTARAIEVLKDGKLIEEAWILLRVLLECHVNFFYFLRHLKDPDTTKAICMRYADAAMLDKLKHLREVNFYEGTAMAALHRRDAWEKAESEIKGRYTDAEVKAMRRNGFTGLSVEERSKAVGLKYMYEACYRIASRSVHMFDPAETLYEDYAFKDRPADRRELLKLRRQQLEYNQNMLLGRLSYVVADMTNSVLESGELMILGLGYEKFRDRTSGPNPGDPADKPGTFRIWRV